VDERSLRVQQRLEWPMIIAALMVIPAIVLQESSLTEPWTTIGDALNWATWLAFLAEAAIMLAIVPRRSEWIRHNPLDVAIVILTPPVVPPGLQFLRVLRLLRPLRLLGALRIRGLLSLEGVRDAAVFAAIVVLACGAVFSEVEPGQDVWDGLWWAVSTVTTVGYGDVFPTTTGGRMVGVVLMFVGIGFVALLTAFVADRFIRSDKSLGRQDEMMAKLEAIEQRLEKIESRV
jgi:voltage-gated potassium channel